MATTATTSSSSLHHTTTTPPPVATASGWLALLQEPDVTLQTHALERLLQSVDTLWHEMADALPDLEALAEDASFPGRRTAAAVASRVFFHLQEPSQALRLALEAQGEGEDLWLLFKEEDDTTSGSADPYVETLLEAALDAYVRQRRSMMEEEEDVDDEGLSASKMQQQQEDDEASSLPMEPLQRLVHRLLQVSCREGKYEHALGMALEAREIDQVKGILLSGTSTCSESLLRYALQAAMSVVSVKAFRNQVLAVLAECWSDLFYNQSKRTASVDLVLLHQLLGQPEPVAKVLAKLLLEEDVDEDEDAALLGYQLCFDLVDTGDQAFLKQVADVLQTSFGDQQQEQKNKERWMQAERVLTGGFSSELALSFLHKQSHADRLIMENLKKALEERGGGGRNSILHNASVMTHAYLYAGTTNDSFLRDYLDWMKKASNWAKFSATASLGVVHAGHVTEAMNILQPYLPPAVTDDAAVSTTGGDAEGGALFALGLIHGSHAGSSAALRKETSELLRSHLRVSHANEVISHGAALGVGLTAFGSCDAAVVNELKELLYTDAAVPGEASGMAIGMVLVGSGACNLRNSLPSADKEEIMETVADLKNYARETQHEKIIRGISMGLALMNYGQEENADAMIEEMRSDRDPILRYGAQYSLALAYCGTGSNKAIRILLHTAVSDVSDDVRMAAVIGLAFVLYKTPDRVPQLVKLLLESFNPHVRYASCMAVGIAMAGTGDSESVALLEPMLEDMTDYVRQGALMGTAMIYMQQSDSSNGRKIRSFRDRLSTIISDKHQTTLTKMGAILSKGIIDAGGRNCTLSLGSRNGFTKMTSAVGLALWLQHWHWYPMMHMFSMALTPTYTIGLNKDFKYPKNFEILCNAKPSLFAYPKKLEEKKEEKKKRVETVTLSTTVKEKARLARKRAKEEGEKSTAMDVDKEPEESKEESKEKADADAMDVDEAEKPEESTKKVKKKREPEPTSFRVKNPARITKAQSEVCEFDLNQRYRPIRPGEKPFGVIILTDSTPEEEDEDLGAVQAPSLEPEGECAPPEPFEWTPPDHPDAMGSSTGAADTSAATKPNENDDNAGNENEPASAE